MVSATTLRLALAGAFRCRRRGGASARQNAALAHCEARSFHLPTPGFRFPSPSDLDRLRDLVKDRNAPQKHVWQQIVLLSAEGLGTNAIMRETGKSKTGNLYRDSDVRRDPLAQQTFTDLDSLDSTIHHAASGLSSARKRDPWDRQRISA
jgi:hypothetical protein